MRVCGSKSSFAVYYSLLCAIGLYNELRAGRDFLKVGVSVGMYFSFRYFFSCL